MFKPPRQIALDPAAFPKEGWAMALVRLLNQFSQEVVNAFLVSSVKYKVLDFTTGAAVSDSFPINFPVAEFPVEVRIASILNGVPSGPTSLVWAPVITQELTVAINTIEGLASNTTYSIRLAYQ